MEFGMPTLYEFNSVEENLKFCKENGLNFLELNMDLPYNFPENIDIQSVKKYSDIEITVHLSEKFEIGELDDKQRINGINRVKEQMQFFIDNLNVKKFNVHIDRGVYFNIDGKKCFIYEKFNNLYNNAIVKSLSELSKFATKNNIEILFENVSVSDCTIKSFEKVQNYSNLYYTLDVGHDERYENIMQKIFLERKKMIHHMHLHDTDGKKDHFELGSGIIDKEKFLKLAEDLGIFVLIEVKSSTAVLNSIKYLKELGYMS